MKDLDNLTLYCLQVLDNLNIPYSRSISVKYNGRISRKWGYCKKMPHGNFEISISNILGEDDSPNEAIKSVLFHELLHTSPGCFNHGKLWKIYKNKVEKETGIKIRTTSDAKCMKIKEKYYIKCRKCKSKMYHAMKPRNVERTCPLCGSKKLTCFMKDDGVKIKIWKR